MPGRALLALPTDNLASTATRPGNHAPPGDAKPSAVRTAQPGTHLLQASSPACPGSMALTSGGGPWPRLPGKLGCHPWRCTLALVQFHQKPFPMCGRALRPPPQTSSSPPVPAPLLLAGRCLHTATRLGLHDVNEHIDVHAKAVPAPVLAAVPAVPHSSPDVALTLKANEGLEVSDREPLDPACLDRDPCVQLE